MNKKIKSLIVAGLLVVGMSGNAFAYNTYEGNDSNTGIAGEQHEGVLESKIDSPRAGETYTLQDGAIIVTIAEDGKHATVTVASDAVVKVTHIHMKGGSGYNCYIVGEDGTVDMECPENNGGQVPAISHISVFFELEDVTDTDEDGVPDFKDDEPVDPEEPPVEPPVDPEEPPVEPPVDPEDPPVIPPVDPEEPPVDEPQEPEIDDPQTGDSSLLLAAGTTIMSAAGLYFVNKKKDDEE